MYKMDVKSRKAKIIHIRLIKCWKYFHRMCIYIYIYTYIYIYICIYIYTHTHTYINERIKTSWDNWGNLNMDYVFDNT